MIESRGKEFPSLVLPVWLCVSVAWLSERLHAVLGIPPLLTRAEVFKVCVCVCVCVCVLTCGCNGMAGMPCCCTWR